MHRVFRIKIDVKSIVLFFVHGQPPGGSIKRVSNTGLGAKPTLLALGPWFLLKLGGIFDRFAALRPPRHGVKGVQKRNDPNKSQTQEVISEHTLQTYCKANVLSHFFDLFLKNRNGNSLPVFSVLLVCFVFLVLSNWFGHFLCPSKGGGFRIDFNPPCLGEIFLN